MDSNTRPSKVYTIATNINNAKIEEDYTTKEEGENNQQWGEDFAIAKLFHIGSTSTSKDLPTYMLENDQHYYVDTPRALQ
jgi:hypothetical protein